MSITLTYQPGKSISLNNLLLIWDMDRCQTRQLLNDVFEISDTEIDLSQYNNGDTSQNIIQRRDIYRNYQGLHNFFFLNFDKEDKLRDIEIHYGVDVRINGEVINFSMDIEEVAQLLDRVSGEKTILSEGEYFFKNLKLTIASRNAIGGEGSELSYFYCSKNVMHLSNIK
ncbi:hypothetical protein [Foetidibacter luteolus]|uniref:hypothetical protein n=1 Tax=Foetidibacter luteolus TaxID=2608880 RepID=UPI00129B0B7B|nr:hypothetical protein [Foetidibacter luteolus]